MGDKGNGLAGLARDVKNQAGISPAQPADAREEFLYEHPQPLKAQALKAARPSDKELDRGSKTRPNSWSTTTPGVPSANLSPHFSQPA